MLDPAFPFREHLQFTFGAVHELVVGALRPMQRDLGVLFPMRNQEGHADAVQDTVQVNLLGDGHELLHVLCTPHPPDVLPVMRHGETALLGQPLLLDIAPIVICAPDHAAGKSRLECDGTRAVVAAKRNAFEADTLGIDVVARLEPVDDATGPVFAVIACGQAVHSQRFSGTWLVDHERRDATGTQPARQPYPVLHLLGGVQTVYLHENRGAPADTLGSCVESADDLALVRYLDALAVFVRELGTLVEGGQHALVESSATL